MEDENSHKKTFISWTFPEFIKYQRGASWYLVALLIGTGLFVYAILAKNFLFALIIVMTAIIIFLYENKTPELIRFTVTKNGIELGKNSFLWKDLKNFWIVYEPPEIKRLYLETKKIFLSRLSIPLEKQNPLIIRKILVKYISEDLDKENEATSDALERILKL